MSEKNTLSILENIKKKMQKFDQEPKGIETVSNVNDEFEYISSGRSKVEEVKNNTQVATENNFDKNSFSSIDAQLKPTLPSVALEENLKIENKPSIQTEEIKPSATVGDDLGDDLGLGDLIKDDQSAANVVDNVASNSVPLKKESTISSTLKDEFDDLKLSFDEVQSEPELQKNQNQDNVKNSKKDEDLDLDLNLNETHEEVQKSELDGSLDEDFADLDLDKLLNEEVDHKNDASGQENKPKVENAEVKIAEIQTKSEPEKTKSSDQKQIDEEQFLKDLGLENLNNQTLDVIKSQPAKQENANQDSFHKRMEEIDLDNLESELDNKLQTTNQSADQGATVDTSKKLTINSEMEKNDLKDASQNNSVMHNDSSNSDFSVPSKEILETKIQSWIDQNLQPIVERIVQEEVKKLFEKR